MKVTSLIMNILSSLCAFSFAVIALILTIIGAVSHPNQITN